MHVHVSGAQHYFDVQTNSFSLMIDQSIFSFEETHKSIQVFEGDVYCPATTCSQQNCVYVHTWKEIDENSHECKACCGVLNIHFNEQIWKIMLFLAVLFCQKRKS